MKSFKNIKKSILMLILILIVFSISVSAHDIEMGTFEIYKEKGNFKMDVKLDREDFLKCMQYNYTNFAKDDGLTAIQVFFEAYLESNFQMEINGSCITPSVQSIQYSDHFITLTTNLNYSASQVSEINVQNTFFLEVEPKQINIMKFNLMGRKRSFRLDSNRTSIKVDYE